MIEGLSIVYPMYNEKDNIREAVSEALRVGHEITSDFEVVIVNDCSTDGCDRIADELSSIYPEVKAVHHKQNRGLGGAIRSGFDAATKQWVLYIDGDLPIKMDDAKLAMPLTQEADIVIGWRKSRAESMKREIMSKAYNRIIRTFFDLHVIDVNFAFKLCRKSFLDKILLTSEGSFIDAELLLEMKRVGARFAEIGLDYYPRVAGVSTLASNKVVIKILGEMLAYRLEAHGKQSNSFSGKRRRLWLERANQRGNNIGI